MEYWIIFPEERRIEIYIIKNKEYVLFTDVKNENASVLKNLITKPKLKIAYAQVFRELFEEGNDD